MTTWLLVTAIVWGIYSSLTMYGALAFPAFSYKNKLKCIFLVLAFPFYGAYLTNKKMGHKISDAAKVDLYYELPWWASVGLRHLSSPEVDDD